MWPRNNKISYATIFGRNIRACRIAKGLSLKQLAEEELGWPKELLDDIEHGFSDKIDVRFMVELSEYFNIPLDTLIRSEYFTPPEKLYDNNTAEVGE